MASSLLGNSKQPINSEQNGYQDIIHSSHSVRSARAARSDSDYIRMPADEDDDNCVTVDLNETASDLLVPPSNKKSTKSMRDHENTQTYSTGGTTDGSVFDDLEFLHDFLEHEAKQPFFESNFFKISCKNISILILLIGIVGIGIYVLYYEIGDFFTLEFFKLATIPIICIAFTYGHIALALWMTFWPTEFFPHPALQWKSGPFKGYGLGWQGIVPMKAVKMAQIAVDLMVPDVIKMEDVVSKIDPAQVTVIVEPALSQILQILIPRIAAKQAPIGWAILPEPMKQKMVSVAMADSHTSIENMISDINENIEDLFDLHEFTANALRNDKELLSRIFLKCGRKELIFIRNFGGVMGLVFGLAQMFANIYFSGNYWFDHLMLPVSGFLLGWLTNWIALKLIFRPIEPIIFKLFCCCGPTIKIQGLFLKRQREVSVEFAAMITKQIMTAENILGAMYRGPSSDNLFRRVTVHLQDACDRFAGYDKFKPLIEYAIGTEKYKEVKQEVIDGLFNCLEMKCAEEILKVQKKLEEYTDETMDIERLLRTKMAALTSHQFEGVLHPVFEQDEIKLIAIGAMLGLLVGLFQVYIIKN